MRWIATCAAPCRKWPLASTRPVSCAGARSTHGSIGWPRASTFRPSKPCGARRGESPSLRPRWWKRRGTFTCGGRGCCMDPNEVRAVCQGVREQVRRVVVGQDAVVDLLLAALLSEGHVLLEGVPGTAKTLIARGFAAALRLSFNRIQFTPDLMPGDVIGTNLFNFQTNQFVLSKGPVFTELLLADEINRTPPKTQAALLQAMQERTVTIDGRTHRLGSSFLVIATQNPIEQEGTYPLPEAQLDRFLFKVVVDYPAATRSARWFACTGIAPRSPRWRSSASRPWPGRRSSWRCGASSPGSGSRKRWSPTWSIWSARRAAARSSSRGPRPARPTCWPPQRAPGRCCRAATT